MKRRQKAAEDYNAEYGSRLIKVDVYSSLGYREPYCLTFAKTLHKPHEIWYHITASELNKLIPEDWCKVYGRTPWGPLVQLVVFNYRVMGVRKLSEERQKEIFIELFGE